jgi:sulfite reductase (ferredoxin)
MSTTEKAEKKTQLERLKEGSSHLRGTLAEELRAEAPTFTEGSKTLLKFHGIYQQDDRDTRKQEKRYSFMVRCKMPGGRLDAAQYLALDGLADR